MLKSNKNITAIIKGYTKQNDIQHDKMGQVVKM